MLLVFRLLENDIMEFPEKAIAKEARRSRYEDGETVLGDVKMGEISFRQLEAILKRYVEETNTSLHIVLTGGQAMAAYGVERATNDIDAEMIEGDVDHLSDWLLAHSVQSDISEDISGWGMISLPPSYKNRVRNVITGTHLRIDVLNPIDWVISKLGRGTDEDINDVMIVVEKLRLHPKDIFEASESAIKISPRDVTHRQFRLLIKNVLDEIADKRRVSQG